MPFCVIFGSHSEFEKCKFRQCELKCDKCVAILYID